MVAHGAPGADAHDDALSASAVGLAMRAEARARFALRVVEATGSTNADLLAAAATLPGGTVLAAEEQTAGRGRRGRQWHASRGECLTFSVLWKFGRGAGALSGLSLAVGLAVAQALERCGARGVLLKWPNDLVARPLGQWAKLGGILIEIAAREREPAAAVIGIGLNAHLRRTTARIDQAATDLASLGADVSRNTTLARVLEELAIALPAFEASGFARLAPAWNERHAFAGQRVVLSDAAADYEGIAAGVDTDGALLVDTPEGRRRWIAGDVSLRAGL